MINKPIELKAFKIFSYHLWISWRIMFIWLNTWTLDLKITMFLPEWSSEQDKSQMYWDTWHSFFSWHIHTKQISVRFTLWKLWFEADSGQGVERISLSNIPHAAEQHAFSHTWQVHGMSALSSYLSQNYLYKRSAMDKGSNWVWGSLDSAYSSN